MLSVCCVFAFNLSQFYLCIQLLSCVERAEKVVKETVYVSLNPTDGKTRFEK